MNDMLHGKRFFTHLGICAFLLLLAALPPQASAAVPGGVSLITPADGAVLDPPGAAPFTWGTSDPAADWYFLYVTKDGSPYFSRWTPTNSLTAVNGLPGGTYTWWIRTWNSSGFGPWSGPSTFTVNAGTPGTVTLVAPLGTIETNATVNYTWTQDTSSTWYQFYSARNGQPFVSRWFGPSDLTLSDNNVTAAVPGHTSGAYTWYVRPWGPDGFGQWSAPGTFTVQASGEPGPVTLFTPGNGSTAPSVVTLTWSQTDPAAEWFYVWVNRDNTAYTQRWVPTNSLTFSDGLPAGTYTWWVRPWNANGFGPWSSPFSFNVVGGIPTNVTAVAPIGGVSVTTTNVAYEWTDDPSATWYQLYVNQNNTLFLNQWFRASDLSFVNGTDRTVTISNEPTGDYTWWVRGWSPDGTGPWSNMGSYTRTP